MYEQCVCNVFVSYGDADQGTKILQSSREMEFRNRNSIRCRYSYSLGFTKTDNGKKK